MRYVRVIFLAMVWVPLAGQAWDLRVERSFLSGQGLEPTVVGGMGPLTRDDLDRGRGVILSVNHRLVRVNPVLRLDWTAEYNDWRTDGVAQIGAGVHRTHLEQRGFGAGVNAQFWIPFTGAAGELGVIQRFQDYRYTLSGSSVDHRISRTWLRVGARWRLALPSAAPYVAVSYQRPLGSSRPSRQASYPDLAACLAAQGSGQEFERMWTVGVGVQF